MIRLKRLLKEQNNKNLFYVIVLFNAGVHRRSAPKGVPASHRSSGSGLSATSPPNGLTSAQLPIFQLTLPGAEPRDRWADLGTDGPGARSQPTARRTSQSFRSRHWRQTVSITHISLILHHSTSYQGIPSLSHRYTWKHTTSHMCYILQTSTEQRMNWWGRIQLSSLWEPLGSAIWSLIIST